MQVGRWAEAAEGRQRLPGSVRVLKKGTTGSSLNSHHRGQTRAEPRRVGQLQWEQIHLTASENCQTAPEQVRQERLPRRVVERIRNSVR